MNQSEKQALLDEAYRDLENTNQAITHEIVYISKEIDHKRSLGLRMSDDDAYVRAILLNKQEHQRDLMVSLVGSPYFSRFDFDADSYFISKFSLPEAHIYSWVTPVARLRFQELGEIAYARADHSLKSGILSRKDSLVIVNQTIKFFTHEHLGLPRTLVHQEHFTHKSSGFMLPEVVAQMEKIQDDIIRLAPLEPMMITGPAGSGKTTLALHRLAFMLQAPESEGLFDPRACAVFVQDPSTRDYFSKLLPELGIHDVEIITFDAWALSVLGLEGYTITTHDTLDDATRYAYEHEKYVALKNGTLIVQKKSKILDRFDITALLQQLLEKEGKLTRTVEQTRAMPHGVLKRIHKRVPVQFHVLIVDEFQNYLPEQIDLLKTCVPPRMNTLMYVGDGAQKTSIGAIGGSVHALVTSDRRITLDKVYRSTFEIIQYLAKQGYDVSPREGMRHGDPVQELSGDGDEKIRLIIESIAYNPEQTIGILVPKVSDKHTFQPLATSPRVQVMTFREAQGVEFDQVIITQLLTYTVPTDNPALALEIQKIVKDLNYVALTRAIHSLTVFIDFSFKLC